MFTRNQKHWRRLVAITIVAALISAGGIGINLPNTLAKPGGYAFTPISFLADPAPGPQGGVFVNDFEPGRINNNGDLVFGADISTGGEGVYLLRKGVLTEMLRTGEPAPGGGVVDSVLLGPSTQNDVGDAAVSFALSPFSFPVGVNSGTYFYSHSSRELSAVVRPGITPSPAGGTFAGVFFGVNLNNRGSLVFQGIFATDQGIHLPDEDYVGLGIGVFKADKKGNISTIVKPGDPAPGGGTFDWATGPPWLNDGDNVAFCGHIAGEECKSPTSAPQSFIMACLASLYLYTASTGEIVSIAHLGDPAPGGGIFRQAFAPVMNNRGDIVFLGDITSPPNAGEVVGVYLHSGGITIPVARPGDPMPGGGHYVSGSNLIGVPQVHVNNSGEVVFNCILDTDVNSDGTADTGLFAWSHGSLRLVARTGTVIPGVGTIDRFAMMIASIPPAPFVTPSSGALNNDRGQVYFGAMLADGRGVQLVATPKP